MIDYVVHNETQNFPNNFKNPKTVLETLQERYPYLYDSLMEDEYELEYDGYDLFQEILFENKVVGFITFHKFTFVENQFSITECFIMPEFRGNNTLFEILRNLIITDNFEFFIHNPNRAFMKVLTKNNLAYEFDDNLFVSYMNFHVEVSEVYLNSNIEELFNDSFVEFPYKANIYDYNLSSSLFRDPLSNFLNDVSIFACTNPRKFDLDKYNLHAKFKSIDADYLKSRFNTWMDNQDYISKFFKDAEDNLFENISVDKMIGTEDELDEDFIETLKEFNLTAEDGFKIRKHVLDALDKKQITMHSYNVRINYLLKNIGDVNREIGDYDDNVKKCPFCHNRVPDFLNSCVFCGLHIRNIDFEKHALEKYSSFGKVLKNVVKSKVSKFFRR